MRGRLLSARAEVPVSIEVARRPDVAGPGGATSSVGGDNDGERLLTTAEANAFMRRAKGFLEKRRSSGIDSPKYIQASRGGPAFYRVRDLLAWEDGQVRTSTSEWE